MSRFLPVNLIPSYERKSGEVSQEDYAAQLARCQGCLHRIRGRCRLANQPIQLIARKQDRACPLDREPKAAAAPPAPARSYPEAEPREVRRLAAVCCHYNPCGYERLEENYHRFRTALPPGLDLWTIELAYDDRPHRLPEGPRMIRLRGDSQRHVLWQKERMLNLGFEQIPADYDAICWLDRDVIFPAGDWVDRTLQALSRYNVCQLFERWMFMDGRGRIGTIRPGHVHAKLSGQGYGQPGGAWAARREVLAGGIYDRHIVGGGDSVLAWAFDTGQFRHRFLKNGTKWQAYYDRSAQEIHARSGGSLTCLTGDAVHLYHGDRDNRQYRDRYQILHAGDYDPQRDVEIDPRTGLLQWTASAQRDKSAMIAGVARYFASRQEDG